MNPFRKIEIEQNASIVDEVSVSKRFSIPKTGWIKTVRTALSMSGAALARRLGSHRSLVSYLERAENDGSITIKKLKDAAEAMNCELIYAIIPKETVENSRPKIEDIIRKQAMEKAKSVVLQASAQMELESQQLSKEALSKEINRLAEQLINDMSQNFWEID